MKILVTGSNGQLGCWMRIAAASSKHDFVFSARRECSEGNKALVSKMSNEKADLTTVPLDITDESQVLDAVNSLGIDAIVNCAAYTDVERAEDEKEMAYKVNAEAVSFMANAMKGVDGLMLHVSTDYVFDGTIKRPYKEDYHIAPLSVYGESKAEGEKAIMSSGCNYEIVRTSGLYSEFGKNFVKTMFNLVSTKPEVSVVSDQEMAPTYARDLAFAIIAMLDAYNGEKTGEIYHYSNLGLCSWWDIANVIRHACNSKCRVKECSLYEYPSKAKRPLYSALSHSKIVSAFKLKIPCWDASLAECIKKLQC